ncbi:unnamed protein product [Gordionus sp. m RMFG-2023]
MHNVKIEGFLSKYKFSHHRLSVNLSTGALKGTVRRFSLVEKTFSDTHHTCNGNYETVKEILKRFSDICVKRSNGIIPQKGEQRLLRNLAVHNVVLELLQIPYDKKNDKQMIDIIHEAHKFLQNFCLANKTNQSILHKHIDLFMTPGVLEAQTMRSIFKDNIVLCNEITDTLVEHFINNIQTQGRIPDYLKFLECIVKAEGQYIRKCQDIVTTELENVGEDVLVFYNDDQSFKTLVSMMKRYSASSQVELGETNDLHWNQAKKCITTPVDKSLEPLVYHISLVHLLAICTEGKNAFTEIKCHSLLTLDDIIKIVLHPDCLIEVKDAYVNFLTQCYIDTEIEMKEIYSSNHIWILFENFLEDIDKVISKDLLRSLKYDSNQILLENYVCTTMMNAIISFFISPFSEQSVTVKCKQPLYIRILEAACKLSQSTKISGGHKYHVENCIRALCDTARNRNIAIPVDLETEIEQLFSQAQTLIKHSKLWLSVGKAKLESSNNTDKEYKVIVQCFQEMITYQEQFFKPLMHAELSILVDILHRPEYLYPPYSEIRIVFESGGLILRLIKHTSKLYEEKEETLCIKILQTLKEMMTIHETSFILDPKHLLKEETPSQGAILRNSLLVKYFNAKNMTKEIKSKDPKKIAKSKTTLDPEKLSDVQDKLDKQGATNLIIDLIIKNPNLNIFMECLELGIAVLEGGNQTVQKSFHEILSKDALKCDSFFKVISEHILNAQMDIKSSTSANIGDSSTSQKKEEMKLLKSLGCLQGAKEKSSFNISKPYMLHDKLKTQLDEAGKATYNAIKSVARSFGKALKPNEQQTNNTVQSENYDKFGNNLNPNVLLDESDKNTYSQLDLMIPILRFLQLLCENHNILLQNFLRSQNMKTNSNMVSETLQFLDCICGSTSGGLGLLGLYINEENVNLISQILNTLTEYCQGPCIDNQNCIARHESNGIDIIIALILNDIIPLGKYRLDLALELKYNATKLLLSLMESRHDNENSERILFNLNPKHLVEVIVKAFHEDVSTATTVNNLSKKSNDIRPVTPTIMDTEHTIPHPFNGSHLKFSDFDVKAVSHKISPKVVGHDIYILALHLSHYNPELSELLDPWYTQHDVKTKRALEIYAKTTAQIEIVRKDQRLEQIIFPIPSICEYLTEGTKNKVFNEVKRDEQGRKVGDFFSIVPDLYSELKWQKRLRSQPIFFWFASHMNMWSNISFNIVLLINLLIALFYPFSNKPQRGDPRISMLIWLALFISTSIVICLPRRPGILSLLVSIIVRLILTFGIKFTLNILGILLVINSAIYLTSLMGNRGKFTKSFRHVLTDFEILYHFGYLIVCLSGLLYHEFFYSLLLLDVVYREETLLNVIKSVTKNGRSIVLTAVFAVILIYLFAILGYLFFQNDFIIEVQPNLDDRNTVEIIKYGGTAGAVVLSVTNGLASGLKRVSDIANQVTGKNLLHFSGFIDDDANCHYSPSGGGIKCDYFDTNNKSSLNIQGSNESVSSHLSEEVLTINERVCDSLLMCIITALSEGMRSGGGIGDVLRKPSNKEPLFLFRVIYDLLFYFIVIIIVLNLIFGVIIDTFADLRSEKQEKDEISRNTCFICCLERKSFDNKKVTFEDHIHREHNLWHYFYFIVLLKVKDPTDFTGPEYYVQKMIQEANLDWFPRMRTMSLHVNEEENDQFNDVKILQTKLEETVKLVTNLSSQLSDIREEVRKPYI